MSLKLRVNTQNTAVRNLLEWEEELEPVSPASEYMLSEAVKLYILCFFELEIPVDFSSTIAFLNDVFINIHHRFSSIVVEKKGRKMWKRVTVNVEDHIIVKDFLQELSADKYNEQYDNYISKIATSPFPLNKPLWEFHVIKCPKNHHSPTIFILKFHHAVGDGTSLMAAVFSCLKRVDHPSLLLNFPSKTYPISETQHTAISFKNLINFFHKIHVPDFISTIIYSLYDFGHVIGSMSFEDTKTPIRSGNSDMTRPFSTRVCWLDFSLNDIKTIKDHLGVTVNDVIIGIIFLGTRLYIQETQQRQLKNARATASILVNIRNVKGALSLDELKKQNLWGNKFSVMELPLPILEDEDLTNPVKFILKAHNIVKRKRSGIYSPYLLAGLLDIVRTFAGVEIAARVFERMWKNSSFVITNLIGPTDQFSFANHPVKGFYFAPTAANLSLIVSVMSYMETLRLGLVVEKDFIDHQKLITCLQEGFQMIYHSALET